MTESDVTKFLRCPESGLVEYALSRANLTWKESEVVRECGRLGKTQEKTAEELCYSVDSVQKWYRSAIKKLILSWDGIFWIQAVCDKMN